MKRWLANLFIVILLLSLTGCISYKENNKETERDTIVISVLAGQSTSDAGVEDMVDEWMEKNFPQVYLEWECVDWGDQFNTQMKSRIAAGEIPDIMIGKHRMYRYMQGREILRRFQMLIWEKSKRMR